VVFRHPGLEHYQRLIEAARSRLADLELDYGVEKSKVDSVRSRLFGALRPYYQERDRLRLLIQYRLDHTLMELRSLYEHLQARILELIEPSSLKLRRAEDAPETVCGETPQPRGAGIGGRGAVLDPGDQAAGCTSMSMRWPSSIRTRCIS
jgi:hypothetical protein